MSAKVTPIRGALKGAGEAARPPGGGHLPEDCPVMPLGCSENDCYYLNTIGQLVIVPKKQHNKLTIYGLFAPNSEYLRKHYPKSFDEETGQPTDFKPDKVAEALINACGAEGPWDGAERIRGRGAWEGEDGDLLLHLGATLQARGTRQRPGRRDQYVYPVRPRRTAPATEAQPGGEEGPAAELERLLRTWIWRRPELDTRLVLGWACSAWLCGALDWRAQLWVAGERGSGKSTLVKRLLGELLHAGESCIVTDDATSAGLRSKLGYDALPVIIDEQEPSEDNTRLNALVDLARLAASGGVALRGTSEHGSVSFTVRFQGLFGSVLKPPLKAQDMSRIAFVMLRKHTGGRPPLLQPDAMRLLGSRLHRRMVDGWPEFRERLPIWRDALLAAGLDARGADQFGTLMAAADVGLHDSLPDSDTLEEWAERVVAGTRAERAEEMPEWRRCLEHITTSLAPQWRGGELATVGRLVALAARRAVLTDTETGDQLRPGHATVEDTQKALASLGLKVVPAIDPRTKRPLWQRRDEAGEPLGEPTTDPLPAGHGDMLGHLAVANSHASLNGLFRGTHWVSRSGTSGGWKPALEEAPDAVLGRETRFAGTVSRCVMVPLAAVLDGDGTAPGDMVE